jgi:hypothetical protein
VTRYRIQYSPLGERWSIDVLGRDGASVEVEEQGVVTIYRDGRGYLTTVVIDAATPDNDVRRLLLSVLAPEVVSVTDETPDHDLDVTVDVDDSSGASLVRGDGRTRGTTVGIIADEPGVPVPTGTDTFQVVLEVDVRIVEGSIERDVVSSRMRIDVGIGSEGETRWVRVADGGSGRILALAPLASSPDDEAASADFVFGLDAPTEHLHFSVSDDPLDPPGDRIGRRRRWARRLEDEASAIWLPRSTKIRLLDKTAEVYAAIGDRDDADRCRRAARRIRRLRRWTGGVGVFVLAALMALTGFVLGRDDSRTVDASLPSTSSVVPVVPSIPVDPGPVDVVFDDDREAQLVVTGDGSVNPGDVLEFVVRARIRSSVTFERLIDCLGSESGNSLVGGDGPMYQPTFIPVLTNLTDPTLGARAFAPFSIDRSADTYFVLPGTCRDSWVEDGRAFDAAAIANYTPFSAQVTLPEDLEPGAWELTLVLENVEGVSADGTYPTIRVEN